MAVVGAAVLALAVAANAANAVYYSDNLIQTNFVINASGSTGGTTTNLTSANYASDLQTGWVSTKGLANLSATPNPQVTFQFATVQIPTGGGGTLYTNAGFVYTNGTIISATVVPQYATNLTVYFGLALDQATLDAHLPISTNQLIAVTATASASTNAIQNWTVSVPATNFLGAQWFKAYSATYGGSNALQLTSSRVGFFAPTW